MENIKNNFEKQVLSFDFDNTILGKEISGTGESLDDLMANSLKEFSKFKTSNPKKIQDSILKIQNICKQGMSGEIGFAESLNGRLEILKYHGVDITKEVILEYVKSAKKNINPKMISLLKDLQLSGHTVVVVSGGFEDWIIPMLDGIVPAENIRCNKIEDNQKPLVVENVIRKTKAELIKTLKDDGIIKDDEKIIAIGDGMTDFNLFAEGIAQEFIGAFYSEKRPKVLSRAIESKQQSFDSLNDFVNHMSKKYLLKIAA